MIYLENTTQTQRIYIPADIAKMPGGLIFRATSTIDLDTPVDITATPAGDSDRYYGLDIVLPAGLPDGEYRFTLMDSQGEQQLAEGVLIVGDYEAAAATTYDKIIEYEQYTQ